MTLTALICTVVFSTTLAAQEVKQDEQPYVKLAASTQLTITTQQPRRQDAPKSNRCASITKMLVTIAVVLLGGAITGDVIANELFAQPMCSNKPVPDDNTASPHWQLTIQHCANCTHPITSPVLCYIGQDNQADLINYAQTELTSACGTNATYCVRSKTYFLPCRQFDEIKQRVNIYVKK